MRPLETVTQMDDHRGLVGAGDGAEIVGGGGLGGVGRLDLAAGRLGQVGFVRGFGLGGGLGVGFVRGFDGGGVAGIVARSC